MAKEQFLSFRKLKNDAASILVAIALFSFVTQTAQAETIADDAELNVVSEPIEFAFTDLPFITEEIVDFISEDIVLIEDTSVSLDIETNETTDMPEENPSETLSEQIIDEEINQDMEEPALTDDEEINQDIEEPTHTDDQEILETENPQTVSILATSSDDQFTIMLNNHNTPKFISFTFDKDTVRPDESINFTFTVQHDKTMDYVKGAYSGELSSDLRMFEIDTIEFVAKGNDLYEAKGTFTVPSMTVNDIYRLAAMEAFDIDGDYMRVGDQPGAIEYPTDTFEVIGAHTEDYEGPEIISLEFDKSIYEMYEDIHFTLEARDKNPVTEVSLAYLGIVIEGENYLDFKSISNEPITTIERMANGNYLLKGILRAVDHAVNSPYSLERLAVYDLYYNQTTDWDFGLIKKYPTFTVVHKNGVRQESRIETVSFETSYTENPNLAPGTTNILTQGVNGERTIVEAVTYVESVETNRVSVSSNITKNPITQIIERGNQLIETVEENRTEVISFMMNYVENPNLIKGVINILSPGANGVRTVTELVTYVNGVKTGRKLVSTEVTETPINQQMEIGTKVEVVTPPIQEPTPVAVPVVATSPLSVVESAEVPAYYQYADQWTTALAKEFDTAFKNLLGEDLERITRFDSSLLFESFTLQSLFEELMYKGQAIGFNFLGQFFESAEDQEHFTVLEIYHDEVNGKIYFFSLNEVENPIVLFIDTNQFNSEIVESDDNELKELWASMFND